MLVISRKIGQTVHIGHGIVVSVVRVGKGGKIRLGILAPKDTLVLRGELLDAPQEAPRAESIRPDDRADWEAWHNAIAG